MQTSVSTGDVSSMAEARSAPKAGFFASTWQYHELWSWQAVRLGDGSVQRGGGVMRRQGPDGHWQYRSLDEDCHPLDLSRQSFAH